MYDERHQELERRMNEVEAQMEDAFVRITTRAGVSHCLAILGETPWESSPVENIVRSAQQTLARALIELDKRA